MSKLVRYATLTAAVVAASTAPTSVRAESSPAGSGTVTANRPPLQPTPFLRLPIGSVRPEGWLKRQLELQRDGLTGSAESLYEALTSESPWLGGKKGDDWEKAPYYVRGLVALAHTLDDKTLEERAQKWIDWALRSQQEDGSFGPASNDDWWPRMVVLYFLRDHYEATGDARVVPFLLKYFRYQLATLPARPLRDWGRARAGDNIDVVSWTYDQTGEPFLLDLAKLLRKQAYPWGSIFVQNQFYSRFDEFHPHHIVNVSQALKMPAVAWQVSGDASDRDAYRAGVTNLDRQYGRIDGQISGTEMLSGRRSTDGVELCADIERIISDTVAVDALADPTIGDRLERVAYNSLPAHTSPRMRQITYYQLPNQIAATHGGHGFTQDYGNGNVPGPHSGFPCCCYNWHAGWPKFVGGMWSATADRGLALVAYGPNRVTATVAGTVPVTVTQATEYPFDGRVRLRVEPERPATFPLLLRVPAWCENATISVNGAPVDGVRSGEFHRVEREWKQGDVVDLSFPMAVRASTWANGSAGLERGPLAFGLKINERWERSHQYPGGFDEFEVRPLSPWNYALQLDTAKPNVTATTRPVSDVPFDTAAAPVTLTAQARRLPEWGVRTMPGTIRFGRADGAWHPLADSAVPLEPGVPHHLKVEARGKQFRIFVDDMSRPVIEQEDAALASGGIGVRTYDTNARFDDVRLDGQPVADFNDARAADAWQTFGGVWSVRDGAFAAAAARDGKAVLRGHDDLRDFTLEATVTVAPGGDAGLMLRVNQPSDRTDGYRGYYVGLAARSGKSDDAAEPPASPVRSTEPLETVELIPFGSAKLRVSYFPVLAEK